MNTVQIFDQSTLWSPNLIHIITNTNYFFLFNSAPILPTNCRCRGLLLQLITVDRHTLGRTPLDEWSACRKDLYLTTQHSQQTDRHPCPRAIRTHSSTKRKLADRRLRPRGHWICRNHFLLEINQLFIAGCCNKQSAFPITISIPYCTQYTCYIQHTVAVYTVPFLPERIDTLREQIRYCLMLKQVVYCAWKG